jgi:membrane-bound serine protease (ClpP class)
MVLRRALLFVLCAAAVTAGSPALGQPTERIEVVEVKGIIDGSVERTVLATIEQAERDRAQLVVLQIDSRGVVDRARTERLVEALRTARVPVASWVGPPGAVAANGAALLVYAAHIPAVSPLSRLGPVETLDLRRARIPGTSELLEELRRGRTRDLLRVASVSELIDEVSAVRVEVAGTPVRLSVDADASVIRFHKLDLLGRALHASAQPSITYLLLLLALVGILFELFHPSTGPAGVSGVVALALALYGIATLGGSWLGFGLVVAGVALFAVDLRFQSLGPLTAAGFAGLTAGSLLLFRGPWLRISPWVLAFGITGMVMFLVGAMTRVLRDLRAVASGELEVREAHPNGQGD